MADWSMTVEVAGEGDGAVALRAVHADDPGTPGDGDPAAGVVTRGTPTPVPSGDPADGGPAGGDDRVDALAAALTALLDRIGRTDPPARLGVVVDGDADRRDFLELDEAAALAGLPAPMWVPEPIAVAGHRLAARLDPGDAAVVLDARGTTLTAWPLERTGTGVVVTARGPVAVTDRIDELLLGVVRAGRVNARNGTGADTASTGAGSRRTEAELRREVRRARRRLGAALPAEADVDEVPDPAAPGRGATRDGTVLDVAVVEQAVTSALGEVMDSLAGDRRVAVEVVADGPSVLARAICDLIDAHPVVPASGDAAVLGAAGLALGVPFDGEDPPAEDPPAEDPPAEDPAAEDPAAEDPAAEDLGEDPDEVPAGEAPTTEDPAGEDVDGHRDHEHARREAGPVDAGPEPDDSPTSEDVFDGPSPLWTPPVDGDGDDRDARPADGSQERPTALGHPPDGSPAASPDTPGRASGGVRSWAVGSLALSIVLTAVTAALLLAGDPTVAPVPVPGAGLVVLA